MIVCLRTTVAALLAPATALVAGCGSGPSPAHHHRHHPAKTASPAPRQAAADSRFVAAKQSEGVEVVPLPDRLGAHETRLVNLTPDSFTVGRPRTATLGEIDVGTGLPPAGVSVAVAQADMECGTPFLATPGHGYRVRCTITARRPGTVRVTLTEHNARTGAPGSSFTARARAR